MYSLGVREEGEGKLHQHTHHTHIISHNTSLESKARGSVPFSLTLFFPPYEGFFSLCYHTPCSLLFSLLIGD